MKLPLAILTIARLLYIGPSVDFMTIIFYWLILSALLAGLVYIARGKPNRLGKESFRLSKESVKRFFENYNNTQRVWLVTNSALWTIVSFSTRNFWSFGLRTLWPLDGFDGFERDFSFEEWLILAICPWIVVYFLNKGEPS